MHRQILKLVLYIILSVKSYTKYTKKKCKNLCASKHHKQYAEQNRWSLSVHTEETTQYTNA